MSRKKPVSEPRMLPKGAPSPSQNAGVPVSTWKIFVTAVSVGLLLITSGCSSRDANPGAADYPALSSADSADAEASPVEPSCDTPEVDPVTRIADYVVRAYSPTCATDKTTPEEALPRAALDSGVEACMLREDSYPRRQWNDSTAGFPRATDAYRLADGDHHVAVIPVQWPDLTDDGDPMSFLPYATQMYGDWLATYSRGKVNLSFDIYPEWITLERESSEFAQSEAEQTNSQWSESNVNKVAFFWTQALAAADPVVDFTGVDIVMFVLPREQEVIAEFNLWPPGTGVFDTDEGPISRGFAPGSFHFRPSKELWAFWVHETLHYFKVPDLYWVDQGGTEKTTFNPDLYPAPLFGYDIMTTANSLRSLNSWNLWLLGWAEDSEITCLTPETVEDSSFEIFSNDQQGPHTKALLLPLSESQMLMVESRRTTPFDVEIFRSRQGVVVSVIDTSLGHGEGPITLLAPHGRHLILGTLPGGESENYLDAVLYEGNHLDIAGFHITVNEAKQHSDIVSVSRLANWVSGSDPEYVCIGYDNRDLTMDYELSCPLVF